jgi:flagellar export protein FliJ
MKKFNFRLEKVKSFREQETLKSKKELAKKISELTNSENVFSQLLVEKERSKLSNDKIMTAGDLSLLGEYEYFLQCLLKNQVSIVEEAKKAVEIARGQLLIKANEEKALSLLRDKKFEEYQEDLRRSEKKEFESLAIRQHLMRYGIDGEK